MTQARASLRGIIASMEYAFFDNGLRDRFLHFLAEHEIAAEVRVDEIAGTVVTFSDEVPDALLDAIEAEYESLMDEQMALAYADPALVTHHAVGVTVTLADGGSRQVRLPPDIARQLLEHFSVEEVHALVTAIAHSLDNPVDAPLCKKMP